MVPFNSERRYAMSDAASSVATVSVRALLAEMQRQRRRGT